VGELLPLFPLNTVLLPGMPLPLHIFEPRYRQLLADVASAHSLGSFGVVLLRSGSEAGGGGTVDIEDVGTVAEIVDVSTQPDGTSDLLAVGSRRFRVEKVLTDGTPYARAEVVQLAESDGDRPESSATVASALYTRLRELLDVLAGTESPARDLRLPHDVNLLSYHLAASLPIADAEKQALLCMDTAAARLRAQVRLLRRELRLVQSTRSVAITPSVLRIGASPN
jgi:Lon protease-like protein